MTSMVTFFPPLNRQLFMYLLDLVAVFASKLNNYMTSERIMAAFQPSFLSRTRSEMLASDHVLAADQGR